MPECCHTLVGIIKLPEAPLPAGDPTSTGANLSEAISRLAVGLPASSSDHDHVTSKMAVLSSNLCDCYRTAAFRCRAEQVEAELDQLLSDLERETQRAIRQLDGSPNVPRSKGRDQI